MPLNRIDPELLISLVENRPLIWDKTTEDYKDKTKRNSAWREVCNVLRDNFEDMGEMEKQNYVKAVVKKWNQIRDSWTRSLKSLSASVNVKKYCYHNQLLFLKKVLDLPDIHDSALNRTHDGVLARTHDTAPAVSHNVAPAGSHDATRESVQLEMSNIEIKIEPDAEVPEPSVGEKRPAQENPLKLAKRFKKRLDPNQRVNHKTMPINNQVKTQNSSNEDRNLYFFKSLLPSLALLDEDQVLQFQAGVISLIQDIKSRRNEWSNQQPYPFHYLHQPSPSTSMQSSSHIDDGQLSPAEDTDYILKVSDLTN